MPRAAPIEALVERSTESFDVRPGIARHHPAPLGRVSNLIARRCRRAAHYRAAGIATSWWTTKVMKWRAGSQRAAFTAFVLFYRLPGEGWASRPRRRPSPTPSARSAQSDIMHPDSSSILSAWAAWAFPQGVISAPVFRHALRAASTTGRSVGCAVCPAILCCAHLPGACRCGRASRMLARATFSLVPMPVSPWRMRISPDQHVPIDAPPHFLLHAEDDAAVAVENTLLMRSALQTEGHLRRNASVP